MYTYNECNDIIFGGVAPKQAVISTSRDKSTILKYLGNAFVSSAIFRSGTDFPCEYIFDTSVHKDTDFIMYVETKPFSGAALYATAMEEVLRVLSSCKYKLDTFEKEFNNNHFQAILRREGSYDLSAYGEVLSGREFLRAVMPIIKGILDGDFDGAYVASKNMLGGKKKTFVERVAECRKRLTGKIKIEVERDVFETMFDEALNTSVARDFHSWVSSIENLIRNKLSSSWDLVLDKPCAYSILETESVLSLIFNPCNAFGFIIDKVVVAMRPRDEFIECYLAENKSVPFEEQSIHLHFSDILSTTNDALTQREVMNMMDSAISRGADSILFLLGLDSPSRSLSRVCTYIEAETKSLRNRRLSIPVSVLFTELETRVHNDVARKNSALVIDTDTYTISAKGVSAEIEDEIKGYCDILRETFLSDYVATRFTAKNPILEDNVDVPQYFKDKHKPDAFFKLILTINQGVKLNMASKLSTKTFKLPVLDEGIPALTVGMETDTMKEMLGAVQKDLATDDVTNVYLLRNKRLHCSDIATYLRQLSLGLGSMGIKMSGLIRHAFAHHFSSTASLFNKDNIRINYTNLGVDGLNCLCSEVLTSIEQDVDIKELPIESKCSQLTEYYLNALFNNCTLYNKLLSRVAYNLTYKSDVVQTLIGDVLSESKGFNYIIHSLQSGFKDIFSSEDFCRVFFDSVSEILTKEINRNVLTHKTLNLNKV